MLWKRLALAGATLAGLVLPVVAGAALSVTPVTWNVIGLDSNSPASGPRYFPVGERVCSTTATGSITVTLGWDSANPYVSLRAGSLNPITLPAMAANTCADAYFEVDLTQVAAAFDTRRKFHVTAVEGANSATSPAPREIYVEHLISQSRNGVVDVKLNGTSIPAGGTMALVVGQTYTIELDSFTATQGYNQFESFINFSNTVFQVLSVQSLYSANNSPYVAGPAPAASDKFYADACGWEPNPASPNYLSCIGGDYKSGGSNIKTIYTVRIVGGGGTSQSLNTLLYDFSGSSFHYNADYGVSARVAAIVDPASLSIVKAFAPSTVPPGGTTSLVFTIGNPNAAALSGVTFTDTLPSVSAVAMTIAGAPTTSGCGSPSVTATVNTSNFAFSDGSVAANSSCVITLPVKIAANPTTGTYHNVSGNLIVGTTDTGKSATADLVIGTSAVGTGTCGTMASWNFTGYLANPPAPAVKAANVATAAMSTGASITAQPDTAAAGGNPQPGMLTFGWPKLGPINTAGTQYVQFLIDTSNYTAVKLQFDAQRKNNGPDTDAVYYSTNGTTWTKLADFAPTTAWTTFGAPYDMTGVTSTTGNTFIRMYGFGANATSQGNDITFDNVLFSGCSQAAQPSLVKAFSPAAIAVNGVSTLTFTLANSNTVALTGAKFVDALPAGVQVAATPNATTTCGNSPTWAPAAGATTLNFGQTTGATILASSSCTASVSVTATTAGPHTNVSGYVSTIESGTNATATGSAVAALTAVSPPSIQKSFGASAIVANGTTLLTITITNPNADTALSGVTFADTYPANLAHPNPLVPAVTNTCGGTVTAAAGGNTLSLAGGSIAAGGICSIVVPVAVSAAGSYTNTTGAVSATTAGAGNTASASLTVTAPSPAINLRKEVSDSATGPWRKFISIDPAAKQVYFRFIAENVGDVGLNPFSVSDPQLAGTGADPATCTWQTDNIPSTLPALPVASATLSPSATCIKGPITITAGPHTNTATASGTYSGNAYASDPSSTDWFGATPGFSLVKQISISADGPWTSSLVVAAGVNVYYRFTLVNTGNAALSAIGVTDPLVSAAACTFIDPLPVGGATSCVVGPVAASGAAGSTITNTAMGHGSNGGVPVDTATSSAWYTLSGLVADLSITKTDGTASVTAGGSTTYTIVVSNAGPDGVGNAQVVDTAPAGLTFGAWTCGVSATGSGGGVVTACGAGSGAGNLNTTATLQPGGSVTYTVPATVSAGASGTISNTATVTAPAGVNDPTPANNSATDNDSVTAATPNADVAITKTNGVISVTAGGGVTYTIVASNAGPSVVTGAIVADTLPASLTGVTWTCVASGGAACAASGSGNINDAVNLPVGATTTYTVTASLAANATGTLANTATITVPAGVNDPTPGNNSATDSDPIAVSADLAITKSDGATTVTAGTAVTYTIVASNAGPSASGATIADTLPGSLTSATWTCVGTGGGTCTASGSGNISDSANLPVGASVTYTVNAALAASATGTLSNTATVSVPSGVTDPTPGNNAATDSDNIAAVADLSISKSDGVSSVTAGNGVTYTIVASNAGPSDVTGATVSDTLPAVLTGATWTCVAAGGGSCTASGSGNISDTVNLPVGATATYTLSATLSAAASGSLSNTATISSALDSTPGNNTATDTDTIVAAAVIADLSITKTDGAASVTPGGTVTYTIAASNAGPSAVTGASVVDALPASLSGATWTCAGTGGGTCTASGSGNIGDTVNLPVGGTVTYTLTATLNAGATGTLSNTATVAPPAGTTDPTPGNNSASDSDSIGVVVNLAVTKTDGAINYTPGGTATYTIVVTNAGPSAAANVSISDTLPAGVTLTAAATCTPSGTATCGTLTGATGGTNVTATGASIAAGAGNSLTLTVPVAFAAAMTTDPLVNTVNVTDVASAATANASDSDARSPNVTIAVVKTDGSASYTPGGTATYQVTVTNGGISDALAVNVIDALPAGVTLTGTVTCMPTGIATCGTVSGTAGGTAFGTSGATIPAGGISSLVLSAPVAFAAGLATDPLVNTAQATDTSSGATGSGSDSDARSANVTLALTKSDGIAIYVPGGTATYTITVANTGTTTATNVTVNDTLPAGVTLTAAPTCTASGTASCGTVTGTAGGNAFSATGAVVPSGAGNLLTITLPVQFAAGLTDDPLINTVSATDAGSGASGNASDSDARASNAILSVTKSDGSTSYTPGGSATYIIVVTNAGPSNATSVAVSDPLPAGVTLSAAATCAASGTATCGTATGTTGQTSFGTTGAAIAAGAGNALTFTVPVSFAAGLAANPLVNTVTVTSPDAPAPVAATDSDGLGASADVSMVKTLVTLPPYTAGQSITYTLLVANAGPSTATSVQVTDIPSNLAITNVSGGCLALPCTIPSISPGGNVTITVSATINAAGPFDNSATATASEPDPNPANNTDNTGNSGNASAPAVIADLSIMKTDNVTTVTPGGAITYTIVVTNLGPNAVTGATVSDVLPAALLGPAWTCVAGGSGTCTASGTGNINDTVNLPVGGTATYTVTATLTASASGMLVNTASVAAPAGTTDPTPANNTSTDTDAIVAVVPVADLTIVKTNNVSSVAPGSLVTYTIVVTNLGPSAATGATVVDTMPSALTSVTWTCNASAGGTCPSSGSGSINALVSLPAGGTATFMVTGTLSASATGTLSNTATVTSPPGTADPAPGNNTSTDSDPVVAPPSAVDLAIAKVHVGTFTPGQVGAQYVITVTNVGAAPTSGLVTVTDVVPAGLTATAIAGTGWTCAQPAGACTRSDPLAPGASYPVVTLTVNVSATPPSPLVNTVTLTGGGDLSRANKSASDSVVFAPAPGEPPLTPVPVNSPLALLLTMLLIALAGGIAHRRCI